MNNKYTKKQLEELYMCSIDSDSGFDNPSKYLVALGNPINENGDVLFEYADGWTLSELHDNIRKRIKYELLSELFEDIKIEGKKGYLDEN